jgi:hypothetical protein
LSARRSNARWSATPHAGETCQAERLGASYQINS